METAGLHQLRFYPKHTPLIDPYSATVDPAYLEDITKELFGLPLSSFTELSNFTVNKRKYRYGYNYENKILLLCGDYTKRYPLTIEINGGAFDHACINVEKIGRIVERDFIVSAIHAKIDTDVTKFQQLWKCYQLDSVTASTHKGSDRQSKSRTISFGTDPEYSIYEAGLYHPELANKNITRHEPRFTGDKARQFFAQWRQDPANLATLIKSYISGHFNVVFRDHTAGDSNISRRPILPIWEKWLATAAPRHFDRVEPTPPRLENQIKTWQTKLLNLRIELGEEVYTKILNHVEETCRKKVNPSQEVQLSFDF